MAEAPPHAGPLHLPASTHPFIQETPSACQLRTQPWALCWQKQTRPDQTLPPGSQWAGPCPKIPQTQVQAPALDLRGCLNLTGHLTYLSLSFLKALFQGLA